MVFVILGVSKAFICNNVKNGGLLVDRLLVAPSLVAPLPVNTQYIVYRIYHILYNISYMATMAHDMLNGWFSQVMSIYC